MKSPITTGKSKDIKVNPLSLITRVRMRPPQMPKKGGQGAFFRLAPQSRNCPIPGRSGPRNLLLPSVQTGVLHDLLKDVDLPALLHRHDHVVSSAWRPGGHGDPVRTWTHLWFVGLAAAPVESCQVSDRRAGEGRKRARPQDGEVRMNTSARATTAQRGRTSDRCPHHEHQRQSHHGTAGTDLRPPWTRP